MNKEEKQILLKDICARLPYNICVLHDYDKKFDSGLICYLSKIDLENKQLWAYGIFEPLDIENIKPYLRSISSMTKKEKEEFNKTQNKIAIQWDDYGAPVMYEYAHTIKTFDWLLAHHFDFRGLIKKDLALEAFEGMYKTE